MAVSGLKDCMNQKNLRTSGRGREMVTETQNAFHNHFEHVGSSSQALQTRGDKMNKTT